jgi:cytochrome oxidase Cu insertion factor (SCO1/SenC/PrrC family)
MMKRFLILLLPVLLITACHKNETFTITGTINVKPKNSVYLNRVNINTPVFLDSSKVNKNGRFHFKVRAKDPDFYQLGYSSGDFITLLAKPGEKIKLDFGGANLFDNYTVTGSEESEKVRMLDFRLSETKKKLDSLRLLYDKASREKEFEQKGPEINNEFVNVIKDLRKKNIEFIINNLKSMASIMALYQKIDENTYVLYNIHDLQYLKLVSDSLTRAYPNSPHVKALNEDFKNEMNRMYARRLQNLAESEPEATLDPNLKDINGKRISLSSLKGKTVLLTFWSAASKECIAENLQLKEIYRIYKNRGFEIYQINLDGNEDLWKKGVKFDDLPWISVREDDPSNPENARLFNVKALPANYLYDSKGEIIASDLHGRSLQIKLNQIFNN